MAFSARSLIRLAQIPVGQADGSTIGGNMVSVSSYATNDAAATVEAAGYFNAARAHLPKGSQIRATMAIGGTAVAKAYVVTASPPTGNVTIALATTTAG